MWTLPWLETDTPDTPLPPQREFRSLTPIGPETANGEIVEVAFACSMHWLVGEIVLNSETLTVRDRSYQNGDGFYLTLGAPNPEGSPTREFAVVAFPGGGTEAVPFYWYRNVELAFEPCPEVWHARERREGHTHFRFAIPWRSIAPLTLRHLGLNVSFVRAHAGGTRLYQLKPDANANSEMSPRKYIVAACPAPGNRHLVQAHITPPDLIAGLESAVRVEALVSRPTVLSWEWETGPWRSSQTLSCIPGWNVFDIPLEASRPGAGPVRIAVSDGPALLDAWEGETLFLDPSLMPSGHLALAKLGAAHPDGPSLAFLLDDIQRRLAERKPYEAPGPIQGLCRELSLWLERLAETGRITPAEARPHRRAFRSRRDGTLQPFSVRLPRIVQERPEGPFPLLVYLHGSGEYDGIPASFCRLSEALGAIVVAPCGRGTSHWWFDDGAAEDAIEAIAEAGRLWLLSEEKRALAGFSMGGHGVTSLAARWPALFDKLVVLSGWPTLGKTEWGKHYPDYLRLISPEAGRRHRWFVMHGREDRNCPFAHTEEFVTELGRRGASVEAHYVHGMGHDGLDAEREKVLAEWLDWNFRQTCHRGLPCDRP